jgi:SAM-dependent methyltransferase
LHARFVRCTTCGFVYADPRADSDEAERFYSAVDDRGSGALEHDLASIEWRNAVEARKEHLSLAGLRTGGSGPVRFLEIGFGDGSALAAADELGWESHGLEYAEWLVAAARDRLPRAHVKLGDVTNAGYEADLFDVVYAWHCIEHVLDVNEWLGAIHRVSKPGAALILGTENAEGLYGRLHRLGFRLLGRTPWPPTSTDHTYWFSRSTLAAALEKPGFSVTQVSAYENSPLTILRGETRQRLRNPRWLLQLTLYLAAAAVARIRPGAGGKLIAVAVKPSEERS